MTKNSPTRGKEKDKVQDLRVKSEFLMSIYPNMFTEKQIIQILEELDSFEQVIKHLDEFSYLSESFES